MQQRALSPRQHACGALIYMIDKRSVVMITCLEIEMDGHGTVGKKIEIEMDGHRAV